MSSTSEYFSPANCTIYNNLVFVKDTKTELTATQLALTNLYFKVVFRISILRHLASGLRCLIRYLIILKTHTS